MFGGECLRGWGVYDVAVGDWIARSALDWKDGRLQYAADDFAIARYVVGAVDDLSLGGVLAGAVSDAFDGCRG